MKVPETSKSSSMSPHKPTIEHINNSGSIEGKLFIPREQNSCKSLHGRVSPSSDNSLHGLFNSP